MKFSAQPIKGRDIESVRAWRPPTVSPVESPSWHVVEDLTGEWRRERRQIFAKLPNRFAWRLSKRCAREWDAGDIDAHFKLKARAAALTHAGLGVELSATDHDIATLAEQRARACWRIAHEGKHNTERTHAAIALFLERYGMSMPEGRGITPAGAVARTCCPRWHRRALRRTHGRSFERVAIGLGFVHRRAGLYASDETVDRRRQQKTRNRRILESLLAVNELGQEYTLAELAALSVSHPKIRRGELMMRMAGFEQCARDAGHVGRFWTLTCPSRMHARDSLTGRPQTNFDGTTPREAQAHLCATWAKARAALARAGIGVYGFRVAEPHHDGTPHWHMLLFMPRDRSDEATAILRRYALAVDGDEPGAAKHRFTDVEIDESKGSAAGYLAKYVAKNIDAYGIDRVDEDLTGKRDPSECAARVDAWASTWGIRQFQQIGGPSVTVWRELRRLSDGVTLPSGHVIAECWKYADAGDWAGYVEHAGGAICQRAARPIQAARRQTGEVGRYGEVKAVEVYGVSAGVVVVPTRLHRWSIKRGAKNGEAEAIRVGNKHRSQGPEHRAPGIVGFDSLGVLSITVRDKIF